QRIAELAAFVDGTGSLGRGVARDAAGKTELLEQSLHAERVVRDMRIDLAIRAVEPGIGHDRRPAMARAGDENHVEVARLDGAVEMRVEKIQTRRRAPMAEQ